MQVKHGGNDSLKPYYMGHHTDVIPENAACGARRLTTWDCHETATLPANSGSGTDAAQDRTHRVKEASERL